MKMMTKGSKAFGQRQTLSRCVRNPVIKALGVVAIGLVVANCSSGKMKTGNKYGVKASPRVIAEGQPVPKGGGRFQVGNPYVVAGRTYVPQENKNYSAVGLASWYGSDFHGRLTANGEVYDQYAIAAAHPTMPLPSYARVTNLANNRSMIVRVNDRGPFHADRVMDVSETVADALDFKRSGTAKIKVDYVGRASLNGSDDKTLMATLRQDGRPALLHKQQPTMLAEAQPQPSMPSPVAVTHYNQSAEPAKETFEAKSSTPSFADVPLPPQRPYRLGAAEGTVRVAQMYYVEPQPAKTISEGPFASLSTKGSVSFKK